MTVVAAARMWDASSAGATLTAEHGGHIDDHASSPGSDKGAVRMACGHLTHGSLENGQPVCQRCLGFDPRALIPARP